MTKDPLNFIEAFKKELDNKAHLPMDEFVRMALYHSQHGYYRKKRKRVGKNKESDFYTSSTLGKLWGEMVLDACIEICKQFDVRKTHFVEIAAEPGHSIFHGIQTPFKSVSTIRLSDQIEIPRQAIVFSNEWLDAQPFKRFRYSIDQNKWKEIGVTIDKNVLREVVIDQDIFHSFPTNQTDGYTIDWPTGAKKILDHLVEQSWKGIFLTFDYGFHREILLNQRPKGTARSYFKHQLMDNILEHPGNQDITCHLCWDELAESLKKNNFKSIELASQESFFMHHAQNKMREVFELNNKGFNEEMLKLKEIINPQHLGSKFQALWGVRK